MKGQAAGGLAEGDRPLKPDQKGINMGRIFPAVFAVIMIGAMLLLSGCGIQTADGDTNGDEKTPLGSLFENRDGDSGASGGALTNEPDGADRESDKDRRKAAIDLGLKPNEAGKIMVLMYHNIGDEEKEWVRTPANFLKDLETIYEKGYRPVSLRDYVSGNIATEQGFTPVVITFDDGNLNNFEYLEDGRINEDSAVALLMDFHGKHEDFPLEATFFVNGELPFRQKSLIRQKLTFLVENGMDIGNHTKDHISLKNAGIEETQEQIGHQAQFLKETLERDDYEIDALALPFGERPKDPAAAGYLAEGSYGGVPYQNAAILNVGWNPGYSPYDSRFDRTGIPRVRASETKVDNVGLYNYLDYFERHPEERFISDGVVEIVTVPDGKEEFINAAGDREIYVYSPQ